MNYILQTDGGSRGNPGHSAAGWVIFKQDKELEIIKKGSKYLGIQTNNYAEYTAIVEGLRDCLEQGIKDLEVKLDSELATKQIKGIYKVKNEVLKEFIKDIEDIKKKFNTITFTHVYRAYNKDADKMVNECLDKATGKR